MMKAIIVLVASIAIFGACSADEDKKTKILNFYSCLCSKGETVIEEYMKCSEMKPEKCKMIAKECKHKVMPEVTTMPEAWDTFCKNEHDEREQMLDCMMNHPEKKNLNDEEKSEMKEFFKCAKKVSQKFCEEP